MAACSWRRHRTLSSRFVDQSVSSKARRAASIAWSRSAPPASAATPSTSPVAGFDVGNSAPLMAATSSPSTRSRPSPPRALTRPIRTRPAEPRRREGRRSPRTRHAVSRASGRSSPRSAASSSTASRSFAASAAPPRIAATSPSCSSGPNGSTLAEHQRRRAADQPVARLGHLGQLRQLDPGGLGHSLRLVGGHPRPVLDEVARQLRPEPAAERPHVHDERAPVVEDRADPLDHGLVAADHRHELAVLRRRRATAHAAVEQVDAGGGRQLAGALQPRWGDGAEDDDGRSGAGRAEQSGLAGEHVEHLRVVDHGDRHDVRVRGELRRGGRGSGPVGEALHRSRDDVAHGQVPTGPLPRPGDAAADRPEADDPDARHRRMPRRTKPGSRLERLVVDTCPD